MVPKSASPTNPYRVCIQVPANTLVGVRVAEAISARCIVIILTVTGWMQRHGLEPRAASSGAFFVFNILDREASPLLTAVFRLL